VREAVEVEKAGLQVEFKRTEEFNVPAEFQARLDKTPALKKAFAALTPRPTKGVSPSFFRRQAIPDPGGAGGKMAATHSGRQGLG